MVPGELEILGSHGVAAHAYPRMFAEIADGTLHPELLLGDRLILTDGVQALVAMSRFLPHGITILRP